VAAAVRTELAGGLALGERAVGWQRCEGTVLPFRPAPFSLTWRVPIWTEDGTSAE
jgi:hypothetical protein